MGLPTGTVTILMADGEDSTRLWEQRADEMPAALDELDRIVDAAIRRHEGMRPVEQGEGDSFVAGFARTSDALAAAIEIQQATRDSIMRTRMGIHVGEAQVRDGNYAGPVMNRTARIRNAGSAGQILLSQPAADLAIDHLPEGARLVDLGTHTLRGLDRAERIWSLVTDDVGADRPPREVAVIGSRLPTQLTAFVGRAQELGELSELIRTARAITLTGAGGCGKTRLAVEVASAVADETPGGAWFVDLSAVDEPDAVVVAIADTLGVASGGRSNVGGVQRRIGDHRLLLVLDNCEHVVDAAAEVVDRLLRSCPSLVILATSREPLAVEGEVTYRVPSLAVPDSSDVDVVAKSDATALFVERARRARPRFALDDDNAADVVEICRRLEGIPLAIELAAARLRTLSTTQVRDGLHDRFRLLTGGARTAVARQQTLQASVDWSYALLLDVERAVLDRLSAFTGGFTMEAASHVCAGGDVESHHVPEIVDQLVDKSLVLVSDVGGTPRWSMLETVRQYAAERLVARGEADDARRRHFEVCLEFARYAPQQGHSDDEYRRGIEREYDNIRRALQWADSIDDPSLLGRLANRLYLYWSTSTRQLDGARWTERTVARETDPRRRTAALGRLAQLLSSQGDVEGSERAAREAVAAARDLGDQRTLLWALLALGRGFGWNPEAIDEAIAIATEIGDDEGLAFGMFQRAWNLYDLDPDESWAVLEATVEIARRIGAGWLERMAVAMLVFHRMLRGEVATVLEPLEEIVDALAAAGDGAMLPTALVVNAALRGLTGDRDGMLRASELLEQWMTDDSSAHALSRLLAGQAFIAASSGDWERAVAKMTEAVPLTVNARERSACLSILATTEAVSGRHDDAIAHALESMSAAPDRARYDMLWAVSQEYPLGIAALGKGDTAAAEEYAHQALGSVTERLAPLFVRIGVLLLFAALFEETGRPEDAARVYGTCRGLSRAAGIDLASGPWLSFDDARVGALRSAIGDDDAYERLVADGESTTWDGVVAYLQRGRGRRGHRPVSGWDALTPTEREVADLVAGGASNREVSDRLFMSVPTVKSHLTRVYAKLGISTRAQLAASRR